MRNTRYFTVKPDEFHTQNEWCMELPSYWKHRQIRQISITPQSGGSVHGRIQRRMQPKPDNGLQEKDLLTITRKRGRNFAGYYPEYDMHLNMFRDGQSFVFRGPINVNDGIRLVVYARNPIRFSVIIRY